MHLKRTGSMHLGLISSQTLAALAAVVALTALTAAPALASSAPTVESKPATFVGETAAALNGVVNPNGAATKYYFEYGATISYGKKTAEVSAGSGTTNLAVSKEAAGLSPGTTYHFRVVATNSNGTSAGFDEMFKTAPHALPYLTPSPGAETPLTFTFAAKEAHIYFHGNGEVICGSGAGAGSFTGGKTGTAELTYKECYLPASGEHFPCTTKGQASGVIVTGKLPIALVYTAKEPTKEVAVAFNYKGEAYTSFVCQTTLLEVRHGLLAPITPLDTTTKELTVAFNVAEEVQTPKENYNEELTTKEATFPEGNFFGWSSSFGWQGSSTFSKWHQAGAATEVKVEA
jgi:hypothetical protein